jgi:hypothetical protein
MTRLKTFSGANNHLNKKITHLTRVLASMRTHKTPEPRALSFLMTTNQLTTSPAQRMRQLTPRPRPGSVSQRLNKSQLNISATPRRWTIAPQTGSHLKKTSCWRLNGTSSSSKRLNFCLWTNGRTESPSRFLSLLILQSPYSQGITACPKNRKRRKRLRKSKPAAISLSLYAAETHCETQSGTRFKGKSHLTTLSRSEAARLGTSHRDCSLPLSKSIPNLFFKKTT